MAFLASAAVAQCWKCTMAFTGLSTC